MANGLREHGFSAPDIHHADLDQGLLILEDLGDERVVRGDPPAPIEERYETAVDVLLALHEQRLPDTLPVAPHVEYRIPLLRHGRVPDRGRAAARLVPAAARRGDPGRRTRIVPGALARAVAAGHRRAADLGAARFPFAQSALAAGAQRHRRARPARLPGRGDGAGGLRSRLAAAGRARRRAGTDRGCAARPLRARARRDRPELRCRRTSSGST